MTFRFRSIVSASALVLAVAGCNRGSASEEMESRIDQLEQENAELKAQLEVAKQQIAAREAADAEVAARKAAAAAAAAQKAAERGPEDANTAADNAAAAAQEVLNAASM